MIDHACGMLSDMREPNHEGQHLVLALAAAWNRMERKLDNSLAAIRGISLAEYRLLRALADAPHARASRVDLANAVGLTPSGVTRALRPLEKRGVVSTVKSERDARLALATLTDGGRELVDDASRLVDDTMKTALRRAPRVQAQRELLVGLLEELTGG